jgi:hypothetical protein
MESIPRCKANVLDLNRGSALKPISQQSLASGALAVASKTGGSQIGAFNEAQLRSVLACQQPHLGPAEEASCEAQALSVIAALQAFKPRDAIEGMMAAQAVAAHHTAMECLRRACQPGESSEVASRLRRDAAAMSQGFVTLVAALERRRDRTARQVIRVERVIVEAGGQAIVGAVGLVPPQAGGCP